MAVSLNRAERHKGAAVLAAAVLLLTIGAVHPHTVRGAATFVVNRIGDQADLNLANANCDVSSNAGNQCTLRAAIQEANDTPGTDTINFNITTTSKRITPATPLPPITQPVTINGYSQSGATPNTKIASNNAVLKIVLDGLNAGGGAIGLHLTTSNAVIRGLVIQRFDEAGIVIEGWSNTISGNFIGTTPAGDVARANTNGVEIRSGQSNLIGGTAVDARNLISGNLSFGVAIEGWASTNNLVQGNFIGTTKSGSGDLGNGDDGVRLLDATENTIGGTEAGARNVISGNGGDGISIEGPTNAKNNSVVAGNYIGTNAAGTSALGNSGDGVNIDTSDNVRIGGTTTAARNVISGNAKVGVDITGDGMSNSVQGNYIGLDKNGTAAVGNGDQGVRVQFAAGTSIGGATAGAGNVISGNGVDGILISADLTFVYGNRIGTKADGTGDLGNGLFGVLLASGSENSIGDSTAGAGNVINNSGSHGIFLFAGASGNTIIGNTIAANTVDGMNIGDATTVSGNSVVGNGRAGIRVPADGDGVRMSANQVVGNATLGIDLAGGTENAAGVTANDDDDLDNGANQRQNFPVLISAVRNSTTQITMVTGTLNSTPGTEFRIEIFLAAADPSNHGEAVAYRAFQNITTDGQGDKSFTIPVAGLSVNQVVTATATSVNAGNTSEFSLNISVTGSSAAATR